MKKILCIGAHPDDCESIYGTLRKHFDGGDSINYLVLTLGGDSGNPEVRKKEQLETALGPVTFGALKSAFLSNNSGREAIALIEKTIRDIQPDIVYTHTSNDRHQDHRAVNRATLSACRFLRGSIYFYEGYSSLKDFKPSKVINIDNYIEQKLCVMHQFTSQQHKFYMDPEVIKSVAVFRAAQFGFKGYAEAFEVGSIVE